MSGGCRAACSFAASGSRGARRRARRRNGWYADVLVHRRGMGPVTAVARVEQLDYRESATAHGESLRRQTIGARVNVGYALSLNMNFVHQTGDAKDEYRPRALDLSVTWSLRKQK